MGWKGFLPHARHCGCVYNESCGSNLNCYSRTANEFLKTRKASSVQWIQVKLSNFGRESFTFCRHFDFFAVRKPVVSKTSRMSLKTFVKQQGGRRIRLHWMLLFWMNFPLSGELRSLLRQTVILKSIVQQVEKSTILRHCWWTLII